MGLRSALKETGSGGRFNNQDYLLSEYEFNRRGWNDKKDGQWLYFVPSFLADGADEALQERMLMGEASLYDVSKDRQEVSMKDGSPLVIPKGGGFGRFVDTLTADGTGIDDSEFPDVSAGEALSFEPAVGRRMRLVQEVDVKRTEKSGPRVYENKAGKKVETPWTYTVVGTVYPADGGKGAAKGKAGKASAADDLDETVADYIVEALNAAKNNTIKVDDLSVALAKVLIGKKNRDAIKERGLEESMHETEKGWTYNAKKETLTLDA